MAGVRWRCVLFLSIVVTLLGPASRACGDEADSVRTLKEQGEAAYGVGRFETAAELWEQAYQLQPQPALLYNAAQAYRLAGNKAHALLLYENLKRLYGRHFRYYREVERHIALLRHALATDQRAATAPPLSPIRAARTVGGEAAIGETGNAAGADAGAGEPPLEASSAIPEAAPPAAPEAAPAAPAEAVPGTKASETSWRPPAYAPWVTLSLGVALAALGVGFGVRVLDSSVSYHDSLSPATGANVCFALAGVAAATAVSLWLWRYLAPSKAKQRRVADGPRGIPLGVAF